MSLGRPLEGRQERQEGMAGREEGEQEGGQEGGQGEARRSVGGSFGTGA